MKSKKFVPVSEQEIAKEQYEKWLQELEQTQENILEKPNILMLDGGK